MTNIMSERARRLRKEKTPAERKLWRALRGLNGEGFHFRQQAPIGPYIADFADHNNRLIIELDGSQHGEEKGMKRDRARTTWLTSQGYRVLRFWNVDVTQNLDGVMTAIIADLVVIPPPPALPTRGREKKDQ